MHSYSNQFGGNESKSEESKENKIVLSLDAWTNFRKKKLLSKVVQDLALSTWKKYPSLCPV